MTGIEVTPQEAARLGAALVGDAADLRERAALEPLMRHDPGSNRRALQDESADVGRRGRELIDLAYAAGYKPVRS